VPVGKVIPEFRGYRSFLQASGSIVVVDPDTNEIVAIIQA
jgi:hypothetical protein